MFKLLSCINRVTSGTSSLDLQFCAGVVYSTPASPPLQLMEQQHRKHLAYGKSLPYSVRSHCSCDYKELGKKQELHKIVTQKHEYKMWVARRWGGIKGATPGWSAENMACRKCLHQVEKGDDLTIEGTDREEEKATGEGTSLSLEQNGSKLQHNLGLQRESFLLLL